MGPYPSRAQKPQPIGCHWDILPFLLALFTADFSLVGVFWAVKSTRITTALLLSCNNPAHHYNS